MDGKSFQDVNWLWQVGFYYLHQLGGLPLVQTANSVVLALMMTGLLLHSWRRSQSLPVAAGVCIAAFFGLWQLLIIRPQTFSFLLFVVLYGVLEEATRRRWLLVFPPLIMALWTNFHGGFPVGLVLVGAYVLSQGISSQIRNPKSEIRNDIHFGFRISDFGFRICALMECWPWLACFMACVMATLLNPYGRHVYDYVLLTSTTASARRIDEWLPPPPGSLIGKVWIVSILVMLIGYALSRTPADDP